VLVISSCRSARREGCARSGRRGDAEHVSTIESAAIRGPGPHAVLAREAHQVPVDEEELGEPGLLDHLQLALQPLRDSECDRRYRSRTPSSRACKERRTSLTLGTGSRENDLAKIEARSHSLAISHGVANASACPLKSGRISSPALRQCSVLERGAAAPPPAWRGCGSDQHVNSRASRGRGSGPRWFHAGAPHRFAIAAPPPAAP